MSLGRFKAFAQPASCLLLAGILAACEEQNVYVEPPPPKVTVAQPLVKTVTDYLELTGTTSASAEVEIRARVPGVLENMYFEPGITVVQGDLLFQINPEEYEADLKAAEANLARAEALLVEAAKTLKRSETLKEKGHVSEAKLDEAEADARAAKAEVLVRKAALNRAEINLGYTDVRSPVTGRVGRDLVDMGNLVGEGEATVLTKITVRDPIHVYFNLSELDLLKVIETFRARVREKGVDTRTESASKAGFEVYLGLSDEEDYPHKGIIDYAESGLDPTTGTLQLRGVFDNSEEPSRLVPGLFVRVRLPIAERPDMPLVSERAIGADQSGRFVLVVNQENVVEKHNVELGQLVDGLRVIESGVRAEDRIVVNGMQRARPGGEVDPEQTEMETLTATAIVAAAGAKEGEQGGKAGDDDAAAAAEPDAADAGAAPDEEPKTDTAAEDAAAETNPQDAANMDAAATDAPAER